MKEKKREREKTETEKRVNKEQMKGKHVPYHHHITTTSCICANHTKRKAKSI